ncbi:hypothetical protein MRB53_016959 [Persea americana]|uniref:Uncharacterized protein n=1 Tax=Persea americana TaxID=3435 RepID=A0ACC2M3R0_PERAE|nr:hypothetical protein MRB53_016959 [Persea americana]
MHLSRGGSFFEFIIRIAEAIFSLSLLSLLRPRILQSPASDSAIAGLGFCNRTPRITLTIRSAARDGHEARFRSKNSLDLEDGAGPIESSVSSSSLSLSRSHEARFHPL